MQPTSVDTPVYSPVAASERIASLDVLRGAALLGILLMNILAMGLPLAAYSNPTMAGGDKGANLVMWFVQYIFWDGKMRAIFSMMFGAGVLLLTSRAEQRGAGAGIADIHYRRMFWLMMFGMIHAYFIWFGDILYLYALTGLLLFPLRKLRARTLLIVAGVMMLVAAGAWFGQGYRMRTLRDEAAKADQAAKEGKTLTKEQKDAQKSWEEARTEFAPSKDDLKKEVDAHQGSYAALFKYRAGRVFRWHSMPFYLIDGDVLMMMLIGMAFVKLDILSAVRPASFYWSMIAIGYGFGLPVSALYAWLTARAHFDPMVMFNTAILYQFGRVGVALAHVAVLLLLVKSGAFRFLTSRLAAVGRMAFSNYISHSLLAGFVFYGYGFGLFNKLERHQLYYVVLGLWAFNLLWSPVWLKYFRFGPLEWAWRSLTYWQRQPMRVAKPVDPVPEPTYNEQSA